MSTPSNRWCPEMGHSQALQALMQGDAKNYAGAVDRGFDTLPYDPSGQEQQLRTDLEPCRLCRFTIDFETDPVSLQAEPDHSARGEKIICFSNR